MLLLLLLVTNEIYTHCMHRPDRDDIGPYPTASLEQINPEGVVRYCLLSGLSLESWGNSLRLLKVAEFSLL